MGRATAAGKSYPRYLASRLREALTDTPVVLIHGPRQSGKTTLHVGDTGVACALLGHDAAGLQGEREALGPMLETFVLQELKRQASWRTSPIALFHFRDRDGVEVDIVLEQGIGMVVGVEVKAAATVNSADFRGLRKLKDAAGRRFAGGAVLYDGETSASFCDGLYAVTMRALWEAT